MLYNVDSLSTTDESRVILFNKSHLPLQRAMHFVITYNELIQAAIRRQAHVAYQVLPSLEVMGWKIEEAKVEPILMSIPAVTVLRRSDWLQNFTL